MAEPKWPIENKIHINLGEIWYLGVPDITDYKLVHNLEIRNTRSNMVEK